MNAEFFVTTLYELAGLGLILAGEVKGGEVSEGEAGITSRGKKCIIVKVEVDGQRVHSAVSKQKATIVVKHIDKRDVQVRDSLYF